MKVSRSGRDHLSRRQSEIANLVKRGKTSREIGELLSIDSRTVDSHIEAIRNKLGVRNRLEMVAALNATGRVEIGTTREEKTNLPPERTTLIGRDAEVGDIAGMILRSQLVTVTGAGGVGKSRIALAAGEAVLEAVDSGVWLVELASVMPGGSVAAAISQALGIQELPNRPLRSTLAAYFKHKASLLILDNGEHLVADAATTADALLHDCPHLKLLVTSREPLRIAGEQIYRLPSLRFPTREETIDMSASDASRYAAISLFVQRAQGSENSFTLIDENVPTVSEICRRLDGIPFALELAAARMSAFSVKTLATKLDDRFRMLADGDRTALPRHKTMRALIDWSYNLLQEEEQTVLRRVAVFSGGWTLEAAEAVCSDNALGVRAIIDALAGLIDKSQIVADRMGANTRYRLLESMREYALDKLDECGERRSVSDRHSLWMETFVAHAGTALWKLPRRAWLVSIMPELDNARAALSWMLTDGENESLAKRIATGLGSFLYYCGRAAEGRRGIEAVIARFPDQGDAEATALLWSTLSILRVGASRVEAAERAIDLFKQLNDNRRLGTSYLSLAIAYRQMANFTQSEAAVNRALALFEQSGEAGSTFYASALGWRASALVGLGRLDEARALFERDIALYEAINDDDRAAVERLNLAELEFAAGDVRRSLALVDEAIAALNTGLLETKLRNEHSQVVPYLNAAAYRLMLGEISEARSAAREALVRARGMEYPLYTAVAIQHLATVTALQGNVSAAAQLCGFADDVFRAEGTQREPTEKRTHEILEDALLQRLSQKEIESLRLKGARLNDKDAVELALKL